MVYFVFTSQRDCLLQLNMQIAIKVVCGVVVLFCTGEGVNGCASTHTVGQGTNCPDAKINLQHAD